MLSNCIIIVLALVIPISAFLAFGLGYKTGRAVRGEAPELPPITPRSRDRPTKLTPDQRRMNDILANIETYDGTSEGQVKV